MVRYNVILIRALALSSTVATRVSHLLAPQNSAFHLSGFFILSNVLMGVYSYGQSGHLSRVGIFNFFLLLYKLKKDSPGRENLS